MPKITISKFKTDDPILDSARMRLIIDRSEKSTKDVAHECDCSRGFVNLVLDRKKTSDKIYKYLEQLERNIIEARPDIMISP